MPTKVIGVGYSKTGTTTLRECFELLGMRYVGFEVELTRSVVDGNPQPALDALAGYDAAANWPWPLIVREIDEAYPDSRFILTVRRDPQTWIKSLVSQARKKPHSIYREWVYGHRDPVGHENELIARYEEHNEAVRRYFADRPGKLLEVCWDTGTGWREICRFLGVPIPTVPFPHANPSATSIPKPPDGLLSRLWSRIGLRRSA